MPLFNSGLIEVFGRFSLLEGGLETLFVDSLNSGSRYFQGNPAAFVFLPETLGLQIGIESAFRTPYRVGNVVSGNGGFSGNFASFHSVVLIVYYALCAIEPANIVFFAEQTKYF